MTTGLIVILIAIVAALATVIVSFSITAAYACASHNALIDEERYEARVRYKIAENYQYIVIWQLKGLYDDLIHREDSYIKKDDVLPRLLGVLNVYGYSANHFEKPSKAAQTESPDSSP